MTGVASVLQAEKQKAELIKELEDLKDKIEETGGMAAAQIQINKKTEAELLKMQADAQAQSEDHERTVSDMRKKHQQSLNELQEQVYYTCTRIYSICVTQCLRICTLVY